VKNLTKLALIASVISISVSAKEVNLKVCAGCHGINFEKSALGKSKIVKEMSKEDIVIALKGYKKGTYGGSMRGLMKGQVAKYSDKELEVAAGIIKR